MKKSIVDSALFCLPPYRQSRQVQPGSSMMKACRFVVLSIFLMFASISAVAAMDFVDIPNGDQSSAVAEMEQSSSSTLMGPYKVSSITKNDSGSLTVTLSSGTLTTTTSIYKDMLTFALSKDINLYFFVDSSSGKNMVVAMLLASY